MNDIGSTRRIRHGAGHAHVVELPAVRITQVNGPEPGRVKTLALPAIRLGSASDNDLVLADASVSRYHARLTVNADGFALEDLGSTNGTFVRGLKVGQVTVQAGDVVTLGAQELKLDFRRESLTAVPAEDARLGDLVGASPPMRELYALIRAIAPSPATALITGESGTGKELVARAIHELSKRTGPLVAVDCTATSAELFRSELFGHLTGAFTGAATDRAGAFRQAHRGTVFLDEIGELPLPLQASLLRVLETREVQPVGADRPVPVDARLVAATNVDLAQAVARGTFRADLYHRLSVVRIALPPLRERISDLPALVDHWTTKLAVTARFGPEALQVLAARPWPGNVRELRNVIERVGLTAAGRAVRPDEVRADEPVSGGSAPAFPRSSPSGGGLDALERSAIETALREADGNRGEAARRLGISLSTLKRRLRDYRDE